MALTTQIPLSNPLAPMANVAKTRRPAIIQASTWTCGKVRLVLAWTAEMKAIVRASEFQDGIGILTVMYYRAGQKSEGGRTWAGHRPRKGSCIGEGGQIHSTEPAMPLCSLIPDRQFFGSEIPIDRIACNRGFIWHSQLCPRGGPLQIFLVSLTSPSVVVLTVLRHHDYLWARSGKLASD